MRRLPENVDGGTLEVTLDSKTLCRSPDGRHFVHCELEFPLKDSSGDALGFIVWVETTPAVYAQLKRLWAGDDESIEALLEGRLANPITCIDGSFGTEVTFRALKEDPTPYIRVVAPGPLKRALEMGASPQFWHSVVDTTLGVRP
jgi:hypothetical protein